MQIGIDLGATKIESVILKNNGQELGRFRIPCSKNYKKIIKDDESGQINYIDLYSNSLFELIGKDRKKDEKITQRHMDIAKSAQVVYEKTLFTLLNILYEEYKIKNFGF